MIRTDLERAITEKTSLPNVNMVLFDWSGTLVDNLELSYEAMMRTLEMFGVPRITIQEFREVYSIPWRSFYHRLGITEQQINLRLDGISEVYLRSQRKARPFRSTVGVLRWLHDRRVRNCIISDDPRKAIVSCAARFGLLRWIDRIYTSEEYESKPSAQAILVALREFKVQRARAFIVGDAAEDIRAGKSAGIRTIAFTGGWYTKDRLEQEHPDFLIDDIADLLNIFQSYET